MFFAAGVSAYPVAIFHLFTHAFFKAGLFLGAGSVMHAMSGSGDIRKMGGLRHHLPRTHFAFAVYCAAIAGFPPLAGFFSKDEVLAGAFAAHAEGWPALYGQILWAILSVAAAGTAFYMFRLYYLVFAGECRADAETRAHIHESPPAMTWPLLILAVCTCFIGFLGIPHVHIAPAFEGLIASWLAPAVKSDVAGHLSVGGTLGLMGAATAVAVVAWLLARAVYGQGPSDAVARFTETGFGRTLHRVVYNKFYVDELYELLFVRPVRWLAQVTFEIVDRFVIDLLLVNGSAVVVDVSGRVVRWFQNGQVQRYLVGVILGGALILYFASRPEADFSYQVLGGGSVQFHAELDDGPAGQGAVVDWDFDGDGRSDASAAEASWSFAGPGSYEVTLRMTDGVFKRTRSVTKTVVVGEGTGTPTARTGPGSTGAASAGALAGGADEPRVALGVER
jgi:NADH-quinone oxidoreductase subunit L